MFSPTAPCRRHRQQQMRGVLLGRLPADERIGVVCGEELQLRPAACLTASPARKSCAAVTAPDVRPHRRIRNSARRRSAAACARATSLPALSSRPIATGIDQRLLVGLAGRGRCTLLQGERVAACRGVIVVGHRYLRRAGLVVPALESRQIDARGVLHRLRKVVDRHRLVVVACEVQIHAATERLATDDRRHHADDLGALVVHRRGVEVVDGDVVIGLHRMCQRAGILAELRRSQRTHVADALHHAAALISRELLIAIDRQALLQ